MPTGTVNTAGELRVGFYGKLPVRGDFVARHLPRTFVEPWDAWLQDALAHSRRQLAARWLEYYLTSPLWRLALSPGTCGPAPIAGVLMPSVDRVGRYFPLLLAAILPESYPLLDLVENGDSWFSQMEQVALGALEDDLDVHRFAVAVEALGLPPLPAQAAGEVSPATQAKAAAWRFSMSDTAWLPAVRSQLTESLLPRAFARFSLWWSQGSEHVTPCLLLCQGLPPPEGFAALLAGTWDQGGWVDQRLAPAQRGGAVEGTAARAAEGS